MTQCKVRFANKHVKVQKLVTRLAHFNLAYFQNDHPFALVKHFVSIFSKPFNE
jgi:hypothetical protein